MREYVLLMSHTVQFDGNFFNCCSAHWTLDKLHWTCLTKSSEKLINQLIKPFSDSVSYFLKIFNDSPFCHNRINILFFKKLLTDFQKFFFN